MMLYRRIASHQPGPRRDRILQAYPQLEAADVDAALADAAWRLQEPEEALVLF